MEQLPGVESASPVAVLIGRLSLLHAEITSYSYLVHIHETPDSRALPADIVSQALGPHESVQFGLVARTPEDLAAAQANPEQARHWEVWYTRSPNHGSNHKDVTTYRLYGGENPQVRQPKDVGNHTRVIDPASKRWNNLLNIVTRTEKAVRR